MSTHTPVLPQSPAAPSKPESRLRRALGARPHRRFSDALSRRWFNFVHGRNLVYNTCWEDPRLDRVALELGPTDTVAMITSAGCNALDYVLQEPHAIHAVDLNPRQNARLELKLAGIRRLDHERFFELFGRGRMENIQHLYTSELRDELPEAARRYWDTHLYFFSGERPRHSFYFRGTAGTFARVINFYIDRVAHVRDGIDAMLAATNVERQRVIFDSLREEFFGRFIRWLMRRDATLSMLGVPRPQRTQLERDYPGGIGRFIEDAVEAVFRTIPLADNYFWRVYLSGQYSHDCCPRYLKPDNFARLKGGLAERITTHTNSMATFLCKHDQPITRFVLLDHMDWLSGACGGTLLAEEWQAIVDRAAPGARLLWRSGGLTSDFVDRQQIQVDGKARAVGELLQYNRELAAQLHTQDRVHTYGSFYIADLTGN